MLVLALDTATPAGSCAVVRDGQPLGERRVRPAGILAAADELLREAGLAADGVEAVVVGTGPGSFTGLRLGLAAARGIARALGVPVAGVSTLDALAAGAPGAVPVVDGRRREVFTLVDGRPCAVAPADLALAPGTTCVGDGAVRYRMELEGEGLVVPPDGDPVHAVDARRHAALATAFGPASAVEPLYVRPPDAVPRPAR